MCSFLVSSQSVPRWLYYSQPSLGSLPQIQQVKVKICNKAFFQKLQGVGPLITDPPPTSSTTLYKKVTCDIWYRTHDMWHLTCDKWWGVNILSKCQLPSYYGLGWTVQCSAVSWRFWTKGFNESMNEPQRCLSNSLGHTGSVKYLMINSAEKKRKSTENLIIYVRPLPLSVGPKWRSDWPPPLPPGFWNGVDRRAQVKN